MNVLSIFLMNTCNNSCWYCPVKGFLVQPEDGRVMELPGDPGPPREREPEDSPGWHPAFEKFKGTVNVLNNEAILRYLDAFISPQDWVIEITGGEPGLYPHINELLTSLNERGYWGVVKTNGTLPVHKTIRFQRIAAWHTERPTHYDLMLIINTPDGLWKEKEDYCKSHKIPYEFSWFISPEKKGTPYSLNLPDGRGLNITQMHKGINSLCISSSGWVHGCHHEMGQFTREVSIFDEELKEPPFVG